MRTSERAHVPHQHLHTEAINKLLRYRIVARSLNVFTKTDEQANERTSERKRKGTKSHGSNEHARKRVANGRIDWIQRAIRHRYVLAGAVKIKAFQHLADMSLCANTIVNWNPVFDGSMPMRSERRTNCAARLDNGAQMFDVIVAPVEWGWGGSEVSTMAEKITSRLWETIWVKTIRFKFYRKVTIFATNIHVILVAFNIFMSSMCACVSVCAG